MLVQVGCQTVVLFACVVYVPQFDQSVSAGCEQVALGWHLVFRVAYGYTINAVLVGLHAVIVLENDRYLFLLNWWGSVVIVASHF